jgi:hypothetical protein
MTTSANEQKERYATPQPIGLFVLFTSLREHGQPFGMSAGLRDLGLYCVTDWFYVFAVAKRLKTVLHETSEISNSERRLLRAIDATSFYFFLRIYYDTLAVIISHLFELRYTHVGWKLPSKSFFEQLKSLNKQDHPELAEYKSYAERLKFISTFMQARNIRNRLKAYSPKEEGSARLMWLDKDYFPNTGDLRAEVGLLLYQTIAFTDFIGDYFLYKLSEIMPLERMECDHHGYPRALMNKEQIDTYRWFIVGSE